MHLAQAAAAGGEVLGIGADHPAVHPAVTGNHALGGDVELVHAEARATVLDEQIGLDEGPGVEEAVEALAGGELTLLFVFGHSLGSAHGPLAFLALLQVIDFIRRRLHLSLLDLSQLLGSRNGEAQGLTRSIIVPIIRPSLNNTSYFGCQEAVGKL